MTAEEVAEMISNVLPRVAVIDTEPFGGQIGLNGVTKAVTDLQGKFQGQP